MAGVFSAAAIVASLLGVLFVSNAVKRSGRTSVVVFMLATVMVLGFGAATGVRGCAWAACTACPAVHRVDCAWRWCDADAVKRHLHPLSSAYHSAFHAFLRAGFGITQMVSDFSSGENLGFKDECS